MTTPLDPEFDLEVRRTIHASPGAVWAAWTDPDQLAKWWLPAPLHCRVDRFEVAPGGAFATSISEDGSEFSPHVDGCFLIVEPGRRLVFTNAISSELRPTNPAPVAMTADVTFGAHPDGTDYHVVVRHSDAEAREEHEQLGFAEGWVAVTAQLASVAEANG